MSDNGQLATDTGGGRIRHMLVICILAFVARAAFGVIAAPSGQGINDLRYDDERWYWLTAESYRNGDGLVGEFGHRAERMPLYPWFLSLFAGPGSSPNAARWAQWALGAVAAGLTYMLAARCRTVAVAAGAIIALDPGLVGCASLLLTETPYVTAVIGLWLVAWPLRQRQCRSPIRWVACGLLACVCIYLRESSILLIGALACYLVAVRRDRQSIGWAIGIGLLVVAALTPWAYRNSRVIGGWCWLTTRGGISLYDGVRPGATGAGNLAGIKDAPKVTDLNETEWNAHFLAASKEAIRNDPGRIARLAVVKITRTWSPVLHAAEYQSPWIRIVFSAWYVPFYCAALLGLWSIRGRLQLAVGLLLPTLCICALHSVFVGSVRYRLGALPTLAVLAAMGIDQLAQRFRARTAVSDGGPMTSRQPDSGES